MKERTSILIHKFQRKIKKREWKQTNLSIFLESEDAMLVQHEIGGNFYMEKYHLESFNNLFAKKNKHAAINKLTDAEKADKNLFKDASHLE